MHDIVIMVLEVLLGTVGAAALAALTNWVAGKVKNERAAGIIMRVDDLALKVARDVFQSYVSIKKSQGAWTAPEKQGAKSLAMQQLKSYLGAKGLKEVTWLLTGGESIDNFLGAVVENAVTNSKLEGGAKKPADPTEG